jgi:peptidyl-prolyl cis-trans isomerase C
MKRPLYLILFLASISLFFFGCDQIKQFTGSDSDSPVIAKIDSARITQDDFVKEISRVPEWARSQFKDKEGKKKFLEELIKRELIYLEAKKMNLDKNKEYMDKVEEFEKMTLVSLILKKEVEEKSAIDDAEVKTFFDQNADKFTIGTKIRASHILVKTEKEAKDLLSKIKEGKNFAELAKALSQDPGSAQKGGDLGYFERGRMVPEFEQAALSLKPGEISNPVKTRFGYHVIKLVDVKKGEPANFEQSVESIRRQLISEKRKNLFDAYIEKLQGQTEITRNEAEIAAITLPWEKAGTPAPEQTPAH